MVNQMNNSKIKIIEPSQARKVCRSITATLPEWFGIPEANERYEHGMQDRVSFAACEDNDYVGMITIEFPYPENANIYWMGVKKNYRGRQIGKKLLYCAENYCLERGCSSLTVETLSSRQNDDNYLKTYLFYKNSGFKPLFEMHTYDPHNLMVYMQKQLNLGDFNFIDLTHTLSAEIPHWGIDCGFQHKIELDYSNCTTAVKFRVQSLQMSAGIGTHMDAPVHCFPDGTTIDNIGLQSLITICRVIDVSEKADERYSVTVEDILEFEDKHGMIPAGAFVIIHRMEQ